MTVRGTESYVVLVAFVAIGYAIMALIKLLWPLFAIQKVYEILTEEVLPYVDYKSTPSIRYLIEEVLTKEIIGQIAVAGVGILIASIGAFVFFSDSKTTIVEWFIVASTTTAYFWVGYVWEKKHDSYDKDDGGGA